ncbi:isoprenylcysteine carboxylmethyltransferase family protein [Phreatobacter stygius]|uniref:Isoprenylcysteine carboxylmethyltransferase family protein n=2 Tax=Phreatobacter stygius TaxID=1940610 RepID=A0A4D7BEH4_9HYPH|nr:isoprenylcysteine carboxylmethyltransferase family protein [Phreatobacter stygius]
MPADVRRHSLIGLVAVPPLLALVLFLPAGHLSWTRGWLFLVIFSFAMASAAAALWQINPEIFAARRRIQPGTKSWDKLLLALLAPALLAIPVVAGLDDGRFHWSAMTTPVVALGYLLWLAGFAGTTWAQAVNRHFEPGVRIQTDRDHQVIDSGPYALVRHPGYSAAGLLLVGIALSLGSWWALLPALVSALILVIRTRWEDETLQAELPGYRDYAQRVRSRLVPGVW